MHGADRSRGLGLTEVIVLLAVAAVLMLLLILYLPRQRETARLTGCRRNLAQIGMALGMYTQFHDGTLPLVPSQAGGRPGPLESLLAFWGEPDFSALRGEVARDPRPIGTPLAVQRIPGLVCPSDVHATQGLFPAPISYRVNTGDRIDGGNGPFTPGMRRSLQEIEAVDGASFTAAFAERLVGDGTPTPSLANYRQAPGAVSAATCPDAGDWRGDAGSSWAPTAWSTTLYNHAMVPGSMPSCVSADGSTARMGVSSGHLGGIQVLRLDGGVREFQRSVDLKVWKAFGNAFDAPASLSDEEPRAVSAPGPTPPTTSSGPSEHAGDRP